MIILVHISSQSFYSTCSPTVRSTLILDVSRWSSFFKDNLTVSCIFLLMSVSWGTLRVCLVNNVKRAGISLETH